MSKINLRFKQDNSEISIQDDVFTGVFGTAILVGKITLSIDDAVENFRFPVGCNVVKYLSDTKSKLYPKIEYISQFDGWEDRMKFRELFNVIMEQCGKEIETEMWELGVERFTYDDVKLLVLNDRRYHLLQIDRKIIGSITILSNTEQDKIGIEFNPHIKS